MFNAVNSVGSTFANMRDFVTSHVPSKKTLLLLAAGITAIAMGTTVFSNSAFTQPSLSNPLSLRPNPLQTTPNLLEPCSFEALSLIQESTSCPLNLLEQIRGCEEGSLIDKAFGTISETSGISCENYLPWQDRFHEGGTGYIDGIQPSDLSGPISWGIDPNQRPFFALRYTCEGKPTLSSALPNSALLQLPEDSEREQSHQVFAQTLFQRYADNGNYVVPAGHYQSPDCLVDLMNPKRLINAKLV